MAVDYLLSLILPKVADDNMWWPMVGNPYAPAVAGDGVFFDTNFFGTDFFGTDFF